MPLTHEEELLFPPQCLHPLAISQIDAHRDLRDEYKVDA
jgi:hypothetical protein